MPQPRRDRDARGVLGDGLAVLVRDGHPLVDGAGERGGPAQLALHPHADPAAAVLADVEVAVGDVVQLGLRRSRRPGRRPCPTWPGATSCERGMHAPDDDARVAADDEDPELVAAEAADGVRCAGLGAEHLDDAAQDRVARTVALGVVDALEVVEVEHDEGERVAVALGPGDLRLEALLEPAAVQRAGQRVAARDAGQLVAVRAVVARLPRADPGRVDEAAGEEERERRADPAGRGRRARRTLRRRARRRRASTAAGRRAPSRRAAGTGATVSGLSAPPSSAAPAAIITTRLALHAKKNGSRPRPRIQRSSGIAAMRSVIASATAVTSTIADAVRAGPTSTRRRSPGRRTRRCSARRPCAACAGGTRPRTTRARDGDRTISVPIGANRLRLDRWRRAPRDRDRRARAAPRRDARARAPGRRA